MRHARVALWITLLAFAAMSCKPREASDTKGAAADKSGGTIKVGAFLSMTGSTADFGIQTKRGFDMAFELVNSQGGVDGRKVELITLDDQGKGDEAGNAVSRLIDMNGVVAVLGEVASKLSLVGGRICQRRGVPMISPSSTNTAVTEIGDHVFRVCFIDPFQGLAMARFSIQNLGVNRVAIFKDVRNDYSIGLAKSFKEEFLKMGGTIVAEESYNEGDTDFGAQLTKIKSENPEAIFVPGYYGEVGNIAKQAKRLGLRAPLLGGDGWDSPQLHAIGGEDIVGAYYSNHFAPDNPSPHSKVFIDEFKRRYHEMPTSLAAMGYDAAMMLFDAMHRAGTTDPKKVTEQLAKTTAFQGITGQIAMDAHRNPVKPAVVLKVGREIDTFETSIDPRAPLELHKATNALKAAHNDQTSVLALFFQQLVNGLSVGSIYALIALGYTMVYGVLGLINFAHSEVFMMGAFAGFFCAGWLGYDPTHHFGMMNAVITMLFAMTAAAALGMFIERFAYRPVRNAPRLTPLITAIGVSILLQNLGILMFTATPRSFPLIVAEARFNVGGVVITNIKLVIFTVSILLMIGLQLFVFRTWTGKAMRAVSVNPAAARLMGIPVNRIISSTFALGSALAASGGILFGLDQSRIEPLMGVMVGLKAFVAAVLGGIGNIPGAVIGGILIGVAEQLTAGYISADYRDAITFVILIAVLLFRPQGLLGVVRQEKV